MLVYNMHVTQSYYVPNSQSKEENVICYKTSRGHQENNPAAHQKHLRWDGSEISYVLLIKEQTCDEVDDIFNVISTLYMK